MEIPQWTILAVGVIFLKKPLWTVVDATFNAGFHLWHRSHNAFGLRSNECACSGRIQAAMNSQRPSPSRLLEQLNMRGRDFFQCLMDVSKTPVKVTGSLECQPHHTVGRGASQVVFNEPARATNSWFPVSAWWLREGVNGLWLGSLSKEFACFPLTSASSLACTCCLL